MFAWTKYQDIFIDEQYVSSVKVLEKIIEKEKLFLCFDFLKTSYEEYKKLAIEKPYINILTIKPIIEFDDKRDRKCVIPNISCFLEKVYNNLFFDFEKFYELKSEENKKNFRTFFGFIYQEYIGILLKKRFADNGEIIPEISYKKNKTKSE